MSNQVSLKLTGTLLGVLIDNAHLPGYPGQVSPDKVEPGHPNTRLRRAAARWYLAATTSKVGSGYRHTGPATAQDASEILNYLESVAAALECEDAEARREARHIRAGLASAVAYLRRNDATAVRVEQSGMFTSYTVLGGES